MLYEWADKIKHYWPAVTALVFVLGVTGTGVRNYALAEMEGMIQVGLVEPLRKFNDRQDKLDEKVNKLQRDFDRQDEKLNSANKQLEIIIQLMKKDRDDRNK